MSKVLYLCDGKACGGYCDPDCKHTSNIDHAVNFIRHDDVYIEKDPKKSVWQKILYPNWKSR